MTSEQYEVMSMTTVRRISKVMEQVLKHPVVFVPTHSRETTNLLTYLILELDVSISLGDTIGLADNTNFLDRAALKKDERR